MRFYIADKHSACGDFICSYLQLFYLLFSIYFELLKYSVEFYGFSPNRVFVFYLGVDFLFF